MNSLENLNDWSNDGIAYGGDALYQITFDPSEPTNQTTSMTEDQPFSAAPGTAITAMIGTPRNIEYTIDLSSAAYAATIDWGMLPYYVTAEIAGPNIFKVVGPIDNLVWDLIKSPIITIPDQAQDFVYTSTITCPDPADIDNNLTKTWSTSVTVTDTVDLTTPIDWVYTKNSPGTVAGTPEILNTASGTYTIVITPSETSYVYLISSTGSGGTSTFNAVDKTLTISGTKTQVNSHLSAVVLTTASNIGLAFTLNYSLTNPSGAINIVSQNLSSSEPYSIGIATYVEDEPITLGYQVLDASATATSFSISVAQTTPLPSTAPGYFTVNGSNVGNTWATSDTKANINAANVVYTPPVDYTGTITLTVNQSKVDNGSTVIQVLDEVNNIVNAGTNTEIQNMINRSYYSNTFNQIFSTTTPEITDGPDVGQTYTITLASSLGKFGNSVANAIASASYSFTGNKTACNNEFTNMVFVPNAGTSSSGTFDYTQSRASVTQVNLSLALSGIVQTLPVSTYTFTGTASWTPSLQQAYYGKMSSVIVGSGGGPARGGGGGGGGGVVELTNQTVTYGTSYPITVENAGSIGQSTFIVGGISYSTSAGGAGGNATFFGQTASGGAGGLPGVRSDGFGGYVLLTPKGGNVGLPQTFTGATGSSSTGPQVSGGGGAGAGANGSGKNGGAGKTSTVNGIVYSGGGRGWDSSTGAGTAGTGADNPGGGGNAGSYFTSNSPPSSAGKKGTVIIKIS